MLKMSGSDDENLCKNQINKVNKKKSLLIVAEMIFHLLIIIIMIKDNIEMEPGKALILVVVQNFLHSCHHQTTLLTLGPFNDRMNP